MGANPDARDLFWKFFKENYNELHAQFSKSLTLFGSAVHSVVGGFTSFDKIAEIEAFFADKDIKEFARPLQQGLEAAKVNAKWLERDRAAVADWVQSNAHKFA